MDNQKIILELESGQILIGNSFGYHGSTSGELVFQTGITGYNETLTDPSYANQLIVFTTPLINNYGIPDVNKQNNYDLLEYYESNKPVCSAVIVQEYTVNSSHYLNFKNHDYEMYTLNLWLKKNNIIGLSNIDTRYLTKIIREEGVCRARIYPTNSNINNLIDFKNINDENLVNKVSCLNKIEYKSKNNIKNNDNNNNVDINNDKNNKIKPKILFFDCGAKNNQLNCILNNNVDIDRVPYNYNITIEEIVNTYNGIFISNGPGNPEKMTYLIDLIEKIIKQKIDIPIFGICLGHQILGISAGFKIPK